MRNNQTSSKAQRGGDTNRTSSQGRKVSSGRDLGKRGDAQIDENTKSPVAGRKKEESIKQRKP